MSGRTTLDRRGPLAVITLERPEVGNALDEAMIDSLAAAAADVGRASDVRAVLLRASGPHFCVGGDIKRFGAHLDALPAFLLGVADTFHAAIADLAALDVPVVAAVQGSAAGGGLSLACVADIVVAARSSRFVVAYTAIGLSPDGGASWILPRVLGPKPALELMLTNRPLGADEAAAYGIVDRIVDDRALASEAESLAAGLAEGPTGAFAACKRLVRSSAANDLRVQLELERAAIARRGATTDGREGIASFVDKRAPRFEGT